MLTIEEEGKPNNTGIPTPFGSARSLLSQSQPTGVVPLCFESDILLSLAPQPQNAQNKERR